MNVLLYLNAFTQLTAHQAVFFFKSPLKQRNKMHQEAH